MRLIINYILIIFLIKTLGFTVALKCFQVINNYKLKFVIKSELLNLKSELIKTQRN